MTPPVRFHVTFAAQDPAAGMRGLRALLKLALRRFGLRCVSVTPADDVPEDSA